MYKVQKIFLYKTNKVAVLAVDLKHVLPWMEERYGMWTGSITDLHRHAPIIFKRLEEAGLFITSEQERYVTEFNESELHVWMG